MKILSPLLLVFAAFAAVESEIPLPPVKTDLPSLPGPDALPAHPDMPDVLAGATTKEEWAKRRTEVRRLVEYYSVGRMPPPPGNVRAEVRYHQTVLAGLAKYRLLKLTFGPNQSLTLHVGLYVPDGRGPFPAVIVQSTTAPNAPVLPRQPMGPNQGKGQNVLTLVGPGPAPQPAKTPLPESPEAVAKRYAEVFRRGYAIAIVNPNDCAEDTTLRFDDGSWAFRHSRFYPAYPGYDWGILGGWAWGVSRVADYLVTDKLIDKTKLIVTGASRYGKSSLVAAAFDDRLMGAPVVTGGGGMGAYRFAGPRRSETLDIMLLKYPNWFSPHLRAFRDQKEKLPFDQHWLLALCAPRPFIALEGITDTISLPEAVRQTVMGAKPVYELYGAGDRIGVNYANHGHAFTQEDWVALMDFFDKHLRGKSVARQFDRWPTEADLDEAARKAASALRDR